MQEPSASHNRLRPACRKWFVLFCCFWVVLVCLPTVAGSVSKPSPPKEHAAEEKKETVPLLTAEALWNKAAEARKNNSWEEAAPLYKQYFDRFQEKENGEEALWEAAKAAKAAALAAKEAPNWEMARDFYRLYTTEYPKSSRTTEAYFEVGIAHYHMRFFREALTYFKLFEERYPGSTFLPEVLLWRGKTLFAVGRHAEAIEVFRRVSEEAPDRALVFAAIRELGDAQTAAKDFAGALVTYAALMQKYPVYYLEDPTVLLNLGRAYLHVGKNVEGRKQLFYYLNMDPGSAGRTDVLFDLAESYHREHDESSALKLYDKVLEEGAADSRAVRLAVFRKAEYSDSPERQLGKLAKKADLADPAGDQPYLQVLDHYHKEPVVQDARYGLFQRYRARDSFELAEETGKAFLRAGEPLPASSEEKDRGGEILLYLVEQYLNRKDYEKVYQLYVNEYRYVEAFRGGRLQYLVGQALEALSLYEQAAVVYYRALALPLTDEERTDLYSRRAEVYLVQKDFVSAERLLKHLRTIYENNGSVAEFYYMSGRLREEEKQYQEALDFYTRAVTIQGSLADKPQYGLGRLRMLFAQGQYVEMLAALDIYRKESWLPVDVLQEWYRRVGDVLRRQNDPGPTLNAYLAAVGENMPQEGVTAQNIHLHLGDMYLSMGDMEKARSHYQKALAGPDALLQKIARERMNQADIDEVLPKYGPLLGNS